MYGIIGSGSIGNNYKSHSISSYSVQGEITLLGQFAKDCKVVINGSGSVTIVQDVPDNVSIVLEGPKHLIFRGKVSEDVNIYSFLPLTIEFNDDSCPHLIKRLKDGGHKVEIAEPQQAMKITAHETPFDPQKPWTSTNNGGKSKFTFAGTVTVGKQPSGQDEFIFNGPVIENGKLLTKQEIQEKLQPK